MPKPLMIVIISAIMIHVLPQPVLEDLTCVTNLASDTLLALRFSSSWENMLGTQFLQKLMSTFEWHARWNCTLDMCKVSSWLRNSW